jgi:hypothetical protein
MKLQMYFIAVLLTIAIQSFGQTSQGLEEIPKEKFKFLYIVKFYNKESVATKNAFVAPSQRDSTYSVKSNQKDAFCQLLGVDGVIVIKMKQNSKLLTLDDIFLIYNIPLKYRKSKVVVNDEILSYPETLFISKEEIESLKMVKKSKNSQLRIVLRGYSEQKKNDKEDEFRKI